MKCGPKISIFKFLALNKSKKDEFRPEARFQNFCSSCDVTKFPKSQIFGDFSHFSGFWLQNLPFFGKKDNFYHSCLTLWKFSGSIWTLLTSSVVWEFPCQPQVVIWRQSPMGVEAILVALVLVDFGLPRTSNDWKWLKLGIEVAFNDTLKIWLPCLH